MAPKVDDEIDSKNPGSVDYDNKFNNIKKAETDAAFDDIAKNYDQTADGSSEDSNIQKVRDSESQGSSGGWANNVSKDSDKKGGNRYINIRGPISLKKRGPLVIIIAALALGVGGPLALIPLGPIMFVEVIVRDLNDQIAAMDSRFNHMARNKIPKADREQALKGCGSILTIRCKFATLGKKQIEKLRYAGITVEGDSAMIIKNRTVPKTYTFRGETFTAQQWGNLLDGRAATSEGGREFPRGSPTHNAAIQAQRTANNARYSSVSDKSFLNRVYKRFGVTKVPPELKGRTAAERVGALLNKAGTTNVGDISFRNPSEMVDSSGNKITEFVDSNGNRISNPDNTYRVLTTDTKSPPTAYTAKEALDMRKSIATVKNAKPPSQATKLGLGALNIVGYYDLACTVVQTIKAASVAAKVGNLVQSVQYVAPVLSSVYKIKAGDGTAEDGQVIGDFFGSTDTRKTISDVSTGTVTQSSGDNNSATLTDIGTKNNPNYGKNALNSELYNMSANGGVAPQTESRTQFSLGFGNNAVLGFVDGAANVLSTIVNIGGAGTCSVVQNWLVRLGGLIAGVALLAVPGANAAQIGKAAATVAIFSGILIGLNAVLGAILNNDLVEAANLEEDTVARGELAWTGLAGMMQSGAAGRGMQPATADQIVAYQQKQYEVNLAYDDIERSSVDNQLDLYNQFSFAGSFARSILSSVPSSTATIGSSLSSIASIVQSGLSSILRPSQIYAATLDDSRFNECDDEEYKKLGLGADVQCNVRYFMSDADMNLDTDEVARYMEGRYVDPVTGLPPGYTPPEPAESQGVIMDAIIGSAEGFIDSITPDNIDLMNDYAKFLEYCVYRTMPLGDTGRDGGDNDWTSGKKCMSNDRDFSYFRVYTIDKTVAEAEEDEGLDNESEQPTISKPANVTDTHEGWTLRDNQDYTHVACDSRTQDMGITTAAGGSKIRLCAVNNSTKYPAWTASGQYYVNSLISTNVVNMFEAAYANGVTLGISSGYRSDSSTQHGRGLALDLGAPRGGSSICFVEEPHTTDRTKAGWDACFTRQDAHGKAFAWLNRNASKYGFYNLDGNGGTTLYEAWHWSTSGL
jgi:LAS superfamily LD-carboxypeptidase LdcB